MTKEQIRKELTLRHKAFADYISSLTEKEFLFSTNGKWTAGQQLDHLCRATSLLPLGLKLPAFLLTVIFGKMKRPERNYDDLVTKYRSVLAGGGKASGIFIPRPVSFHKRSGLVQKLLNNISSVNRALDKLSEQQLDKRTLPHPLLGKLTTREMMYFTLYHVEHHKHHTMENLKRFTVSQ